MGLASSRSEVGAKKGVTGTAAYSPKKLKKEGEEIQKQSEMWASKGASQGTTKVVFFWCFEVGRIDGYLQVNFFSGEGRKKEVCQKASY